MKNRFAFYVLFLLTAFLSFSLKAEAKNNDEILEYTIRAEVNSDATVDLTYHIEWEVLVSKGVGPVEWVEIGIPNSHVSDYSPMSTNIKRMKYSSSNGHFIQVYFYDSYEAGEIISFDFKITQDYMYQVDKFTEGETVYGFTPGWFDEIYVDSMNLYWNADKAISWSPDCYVEDGYLHWSSALSEGEKYPVTVTYTNDAFGFDLSKTIDEGDQGSSSPIEILGNIVIGIVSIVVCFVIGFGPLIIIYVIVYSIGRGFSQSGTKQIKRTLIKYYPTCQGCGAPRPEGKETCDYCGRSFIESEEIIEEKNLVDPNSYKKAGTYKYADNTYIRVNYIHVPRPTPPPSSRSGGGRSCACASHCACACACACAGGGRAGCSTKDFYNTNLKLKQLRHKKKIMPKKTAETN